MAPAHGPVGDCVMIWSMQIVFKTATKKIQREATWQDPIRDIHDGIEASDELVVAVYVERDQLVYMSENPLVHKYARALAAGDESAGLVRIEEETKNSVLILPGLPRIVGVADAEALAAV